MNKFISLTKVLLITGDTPFVKSGKKKIRGFILFALLATAFLSIAISIGNLTRIIYDSLVPINQEGTVILLAYTLASMLILVFGVFYVLSVFYFTKDIDNLLPLPLKPMEILTSKFLVTLIYEYLIEILFLLPVIICYGVKSHGNVLFYIINFLIFITIPIIPLIIASILSIVIMSFTNLAKNKDRFKVVSSIVIMFIILGFNMYSNKITSGSMSTIKLQNTFAEGKNSFLSTITTVFFNAKLASLAVIKAGSLKGLIYIGIYIAITVLFVILFLVFAQAFYFKGVIGLNQSSSKKTSISMEELDKGTNSSSSTKALVIKELKILFRTPVYFINCILMNFLWPIFFVLPIVAQPGGIKDVRNLSKFISQGDNGCVVISISFLISVIISALNCITSTSISREGENLFFMKYIPVNYKKQINAKVLSGITMGFVGVFFMIIVSIFLLRPSFTITLLVVIVSVIGIILSSETGMILDLYFPKLIWDNEQKAVKQNLNVIINLAISAALSGACVYVTTKFRLKLVTVFLIIILVYGAIDYILYLFLMTLGVKQLKNLEN